MKWPVVLLASVRSLAFMGGYVVITMIWGTLAVLLGWILPYRTRFVFIAVMWTRLILGWLRVTCRIDIEVQGREHVPDAPCVVLVRHESTWETLFLQSLLVPQTTVIKRELLWIPFFGWAFSLLRPIAIDRRDGRGALRTLVRAGRARLEDGIWVVLFPEGTRMAPGVLGRFQRGGAALASAADRPVIVIAHDAGRCWPARRWLKFPGTVRVRISAPIETRGRTTPQITAEAESWLRGAMRELYPESATNPEVIRDTARSV